MILTTAENVNERGGTVYKTWASQCDETKFVLKFPSYLIESDTSIFAFADFNHVKSQAIDVNKLLEPPNFSAERGNYDLTRKVLLTLSYAHSKYSQYDWYLKADDDTFIFVDNLRRFLSDKSPDEPITYGYNFKAGFRYGYHSGGAGYVMSNNALKRLGEKLNNDTSLKFCYSSGIEDLDVGRCLRRLKVQLGNSTDEMGRERFHPLPIRDHIFGDFPDWFESYSQNKPKKAF